MKQQTGHFILSSFQPLSCMKISFFSWEQKCLRLITAPANSPVSVWTRPSESKPLFRWFLLVFSFSFVCPPLLVSMKFMSVTLLVQVFLCCWDILLGDDFEIFYSRVTPTSSRPRWSAPPISTPACLMAYRYLSKVPSFEPVPDFQRWSLIFSFSEQDHPDPRPPVCGRPGGGRHPVQQGHHHAPLVDLLPHHAQGSIFACSCS